MIGELSTVALVPRPSRKPTALPTAASMEQVCSESTQAAILSDGHAMGGRIVLGLESVRQKRCDRGARKRDWRTDCHRQQGRQPLAASRARYCDGLPELRALSPQDCSPEHGFRAETQAYRSKDNRTE